MFVDVGIVVSPCVSRLTEQIQLPGERYPSDPLNIRWGRCSLASPHRGKFHLLLQRHFVPVVNYLVSYLVAYLLNNSLDIWLHSIVIKCAKLYWIGS